MMIVVESLSGKFLKTLGAEKELTPNLDSLANESLFFTNFYSTGTRTVRGMEAITLSVPPTPGRSIVKRPDNHNMYSSGFIFRNKGYETKFIYGGHGYFDNMNEFFSNNGFNIVDRADFSDEEDTFHTVWGVCDEDLLNKTLKEADSSYKAHKPFMSFVMTTSNHRPYDYPDGKIDIPSHTGRDGAVKYTDYAIGDFIKKAKDKPWFKNTVFVIVADHCSTSAGKTEIPLDKYHIPLIIYAPEILKPQVVDKVSSQIDIMPTLFSVLNWSYKSKFYGSDILSPSFKERALIGTYQKLGLYKENKLVVLSPTKKIKSYEVVEQDLYDTKYKEIQIDRNLEAEIVSYYQGASTLHKKRLDRYESQ
jgi:phosphoglycerol transferase MdoB-like AlkP superfamily enzyme